MGVCTCSVFRNAYLKEGKTVAVQLFSGQEWVSAVAVKRFQEHAGCRCSQNVCQCYSYRPHIQVSLLVLTDATSQTYHCLPVENFCEKTNPVLGYVHAALNQDIFLQCTRIVCEYQRCSITKVFSSKVLYNKGLFIKGVV